jgi:hypothetical protein
MITELEKQYETLIDVWRPSGEKPTMWLLFRLSKELYPELTSKQRRELATATLAHIPVVNKRFRDQAATIIKTMREQNLTQGLTKVVDALYPELTDAQRQRLVTGLSGTKNFKKD